MNHEERRTLQPQLNIRANIAAVRFEFCTRCVRLPLTSRAFAELLPLSISALLLHKPELVVSCFAVVGREESSWLWRIERVIECEEAIECSGDFGPSTTPLPLPEMFRTLPLPRSSQSPWKSSDCGSRATSIENEKVLSDSTPDEMVA